MPPNVVAAADAGDIDPDGLIDAEVLKECLAKVGEKVDDLIERVEALQASVDALG